MMEKTKKRNQGIQGGACKAMFAALFVFVLCFWGMKAEAKDGILAGNGSEADPYQIEDVADLQAFAARVNGGDSCEGKFFILKNDVDLSGVYWTPIGNDATSFAGVFLGDGYGIKNLRVSGRGFFEKVSGKVQGLTVEGNVGDNLTVGGIAGSNWGSIEDCTFRGFVSVTQFVGGIAGSNANVIKNCVFQGFSAKNTSKR